MNIQSAADAAKAITAAHPYLSRDTWKTKDGTTLLAGAMSAEHRRSVIRLLVPQMQLHLTSLAVAILDTEDLHLERQPDDALIVMGLDPADVLPLTPLGASLHGPLK
jgi:hypothetical protein